jgi:dTDP-D-glucose 4,6-dehydratase
MSGASWHPPTHTPAPKPAPRCLYAHTPKALGCLSSSLAVTTCMARTSTQRKSSRSSFCCSVVERSGESSQYDVASFPLKCRVSCVTSLMFSTLSPIHGNGFHRRSFMYVSDAVSAFDHVLHCGQIGETYNIGTDFEVSTLGVLESIVQQLKPIAPATTALTAAAGATASTTSNSAVVTVTRGARASSSSDAQSSAVNTWAQFVEDRAFNDQRYRVDSSKLQALGWKPKVRWEDGLALTSKCPTVLEAARFFSDRLW